MLEETTAWNILMSSSTEAVDSTQAAKGTGLANGLPISNLDAFLCSVAAPIGYDYNSKT